MSLGQAGIVLFALVAIVYGGIFMFEMKTRGIDDLHISEHPVAIWTVVTAMVICFAALVISGD